MPFWLGEAPGRIRRRVGAGAWAFERRRHLRLRHQRAAVGMARPDAPLKVLHRFPKTVVTKMRRIEDNPKAVHLFQQFAPFFADTAGRIRKGPAPENLPVPTFSFVSDTVIKIG